MGRAKRARHSKTIKGAGTDLFRIENNDCVVRSWATFFDLEYDFAHSECKTIFKRDDNDGVIAWKIKLRTHLLKNDNFLYGKKVKELGIERPHDFGSNVEKWEIQNRRNYWSGLTMKRVRTRPSTGRTRFTNMTTNLFIKQYPKGTYLVEVRGHVFTIKDSVVYGNREDAIQMATVIRHAWQIIE